MVSQVEIGAKFDVSDHHEIRFKINAKREIEQNTALVPGFRKANYQGLRHHLQSIDLEGIGVGREEDQNIEAELHYNSIVREIHTGQEKYIPKRIIRSNRNNPKWMNSGIRRKIGLKRGLYPLYKDRIGTLKGMDGSLIQNGEEISKELNKYFLSVFFKEVG